MNDLEQRINERSRLLNGATDQRRNFEQIITKLQEWIKSTEQQIKDPLTNDLQQSASLLKERYRHVQSLLESARDRSNEFDDLGRVYNIIALNLNETDRNTFDEKYTLLKDKYNRLLDNLSQRLTLLDEANHERDLLDEHIDHLQESYRQLQNDLIRFKQQSTSIDGNHPEDGLSNQQRFEQYQQLMSRLDELNNQSKELSRTHRLLTSKGHRIDFRSGGELNVNLKNLEGQIHHEIERIERNLHAENDFHNLEKELDFYLQQSSEQFKGIPQHADKAVAYQVE